MAISSRAAETVYCSPFKVNQIQQQNGILVIIENCNLAVEKHFLEFIQKAKKLSFGRFLVADESQEKLNEWTNKVCEISSQ